MSLVLLSAMTMGAVAACGQADVPAQVNPATTAPVQTSEPPRASVGIGSPVPQGGPGATDTYSTSGQPGTDQAVTNQPGTDQQGQDEQQAPAEGGGFGWVTVILVMVAALAAGVIVGRALRPARRGPARVTTAVGPGPSPAYEKASRDRDGLIEACIAVRDVAPVEALREQLGEALRRAGVGEVVADGEPFDPRLHRAVQGEPVTDVRMDGVIASTDRVGYRDGDRLVRPPEVVVYRAEASRPAGSSDAPA